MPHLATSSTSWSPQAALVGSSSDLSRLISHFPLFFAGGTGAAGEAGEAGGAAGEAPAAEAALTLVSRPLRLSE